MEKNSAKLRNIGLATMFKNASTYSVGNHETTDHSLYQ
jgi:hypothetical protein